MNDISKIMDSRTPFKAGKNYEISKYNEDVAMAGLLSMATQGLGVVKAWAEKIDSDESWIDGKLHVKPDFFLFIEDKEGNVKKWTVEVKTTSYDSFLNQEVIIKAPQVWTCKNNPDLYPRPYILAATENHFALIPMGSFWNSEASDIKFGDFTKKGYLLKCSDYQWKPFDTQLQFKKNHGNNALGTTS